MPPSQPARPADPGPTGDIRDLFSFRLQRLAGLSTRIAALSMRTEFGVTPREWRALAVLSYLGEAPLQELVRHTGLLKSQISRTVSELAERGLIARGLNPGDGRSVLLRLTAEGARIASEIFTRSRDRNERMLSDLSPAERMMLLELMERVFATSLDYYGIARLGAPEPGGDDEEA